MFLEKFPTWEAPYVERETSFPDSRPKGLGTLSELFDEHEFTNRLEKFQKGQLGLPNNFISPDRLRGSRPDDFPSVTPPEYKDLQALGWEAVTKGLVATLILAGGTSSRLKENKILREVLPGKSVLYLKYMTVRGIAEHHGVNIPACIMTSPFTSEAVIAELGKHGIQRGKDYLLFEQPVAPRITLQGEIITYQEKIQFDVTGHGALFSAIQQSGILQKLSQWGMRVLIQSNTDNPLVVMDAKPTNPFLAYVGSHLATRSRVTALVTAKEHLHKGGVPLWFRQDNGREQLALIEQSQIHPDLWERLSPALPYFNPLTLIYDLQTIQGFDASVLPIIVVKRSEKNQQASFDFYRFETVSGSITLFEKTRFLSDAIVGIDERGMFTQLKDDAQLPIFQKTLQTRLPEILPEL